MASDLIYFLSALPSLTLPGQPEDNLAGPAWKDFLEQCRKLLSEKDAGTIAALELCPSREYVESPSSVGAALPSLARDWYDWQIAVHNALARRRAARMGGRQVAVRPETQVFPNDLKRLDAIFELPTAAERAWAWLGVQWRRIDELAAGQQFNLNAVVAYALRVRLLEVARSYDRASGARAFAAQVEQVVAVAQQCRK